MQSKTEAQRRADRIAAFRAELAALAGEGLSPLTAEDAARVAAHHDALLRAFARDFDVDRSAAERRMSLGMRLASLLGAAALTAAVVSFVYRIWGALPAAGQIALVTAAPLAALAVTTAAVRLERTRYVASLFAIVACAAFVLQTVVMGQLLNLRDSPHALGAIAVFAFAVAVPWRLTVPFAIGAVAAAAYGAALLLHLGGVAWIGILERPELLGAAAAVGLFGLRWAPDDLLAAARPLLLMLALGILLALTAGAPSLLPVGDNAVEAIYQVAAAAAAIVAMAIGLRRDLTDVTVIGSLFGGLFLLTRFVDWWWDWMPKYLFFLVLAGTALAWLWGLRVARRRLAGRAA